ncbi:hypothetical protein [Thalassobacillus sp. CUG 92003]|uniref:hypothetical protein n=1 Tax=Thalassobacillus sp. CUG 92003 TaxID=2736641 RepID=UPI0015E69F81|nr:hypothetical protein [Thalassobacillus sp. CUG 92003]
MFKNEKVNIIYRVLGRIIVLGMSTYVLYPLLKGLFLGWFDSSSKQKSSDEKIEAYIANTQNDEKGAYKEINSQIIMRGSGDSLKIEARKIEDYYSKGGEYIKTILLHSTPEDGDVTREYDSPLTKMVQSDFVYDQDKLIPIESELSGEDKEKLKEHILSNFEDKF